MSAPSPPPAPLIQPSSPPALLSPSALTHTSNLLVLSIFSRPGLMRPALPVDIILQILSHPTRWIQSVQLALTSGLSVPSTTGSKLILSTPPLTCKSIRLLRKVIFTFKARDQGWSSYAADHGTYENTWTWFDAVVCTRRTGSSPTTNAEEEISQHKTDGGAAGGGDDDDGGGGGGDDSGSNSSPDQTLSSIFLAPIKKSQRLQANRHAGRVAESYRIEIEAGQGILQNLKEGDEIGLVASALFPGWVNNVEEAGMEIWEEDDLQHMVATFLHGQRQRA